MWGHRVVIPSTLRKMVLHELHSSHFGVTRMKALARSFVWWPQIDKEIENVTKSCLNCLSTRRSPAKIPLTPWKWPTTVWHRVHADFLGPINGKMILVLLDSHSKWPEAYVMPNMNENTTIAIFEETFTRFGYPVHLVTDNYSIFMGKAFQSFLKRTGIRHSTTLPYFPATNGAAENFVDTIKRKLKCLPADGLSIPEAIRKFLLDYRSTPHAVTGRTPASLALGHELRTRFSLLRPPAVEDQVAKHQERQVRHGRGTRKKRFSVGENVMARDYRGAKEGWTRGIIIKELTSGVMFEVKVGKELIWKRHANQLIERAAETEETEGESEDKPTRDTTSEETQQALRRSGRLKQKSRLD